jgi:hypothetical protein
MTKLNFFILLVLLNCTSSRKPQPLLEGFNPYLHIYHASSETKSHLVPTNLFSAAILTDTGAKLTNQYQLSPAHKSLVATLTCSNFNNIDTMPTRLEEAQKQQKNMEEAMATATFQQEKEAAAH